MSQETKAGVLPVEIQYNAEMWVDRVMMNQNEPILKDISLDISKIAGSLNISEEKVD